MKSLFESLVLIPLLSFAPAVAGSHAAPPLASQEAIASSPSAEVRGDGDLVSAAEAPIMASDVCGEGNVCCNITDDWISKGVNKCLPKDECDGPNKTPVADVFCK